MNPEPDVTLALGGVLGGSLLSTALFGTTCLQVVLYIKQYPNDPTHVKALVFIVWGLDTIQTGCIVSLSFQYLIFNFARPEVVDHVFPTVVCSLLLTAILTFIVNGFFLQKVHRLSEGNWWFTGPTLLCMVSRLGLAFVTMVKLLVLRSYALYSRSFAPILTTALALSAFTDLVVTGGLCYYLRTLNPEMYRTKKMLSTIVNFADNNGALTCIVALSTLICWIAMPTNLIYLGIHFSIGKCYSNSLLASLNMRNYVKRTATKAADTINIMNPKPVQRRLASTTPVREAAHWPGLDLYDEERRKLEDGPVEVAMPMEIKVDRVVHYD